MAATQGSLRPPPVGLAGAAERHFGLRLRLGDRLEGGFANHVFRVESAVGPLALRASHPPVDLDDLGWEHRVTGLLSARVPEVAAPLEAPDGSTWALHQGWALTLLPFAAGGPADRDDEAHRLAAARLLGRLHAAAAELAVPPRPRVRALRNLDWPPVRDFPETFDRGEIERARARAMETVAAIAASRPLREHVVHGDFFPGNVLAADTGVVGLVDWEEAHVGWATFELANAVWEFAKLRDVDDFDRERGRAFAAAYREAGGTARAEDHDLLVPLIRVKRVLEVLRAPTDRQVDWDYQHHNLRAYANLG